MTRSGEVRFGRYGAIQRCLLNSVAVLSQALAHRFIVCLFSNERSSVWQDF